MSPICGIYAIIHRATGKCYIGSSVDIRRRWNRHRSFLRRGVHSNHLLQGAWTEHGEDAFDFRIAEVVFDLEQVAVREQVWLDALCPYDPDRGYNRAPRVDSAGYRFTPEQIERLSASLRGKPKSPEHCAALWVNRAKTSEFREQMAANGRRGAGRPKGADHRQKIGLAQRGSDNHQAKLSESDVIEIKRRLAQGQVQAQIARDFGVTPTAINDIKSGRRWRHILLQE